MENPKSGLVGRGRFVASDKDISPGGWLIAGLFMIQREGSRVGCIKIREFRNQLREGDTGPLRRQV